MQVIVLKCIGEGCSEFVHKWCVFVCLFCFFGILSLYFDRTVIRQEVKWGTVGLFSLTTSGVLMAVVIKFDLADFLAIILEL